MLVVSDESRKEQLKKIWLECYDDSESYVDFFFRNGFRKSICISEVIDDVAVGALYLFKCSITPLNTRGYYWYAGGVLPEFRNKGIYSGIVRYAMELAEKESAVSLCYPGPGLSGFYKNLGLSDEYYCDVVELASDVDADNPVTARQRLSLNGYLAMSESTHADGSVIWDKDVLEYVLAENEFCSGFCDTVTFNGEEYYLLGQMKNAAMYIFETSMPLSVLKQIKDSVMHLYRTRKAFVYYPVGSCGGIESRQILSSVGNGGFANSDKWFVMTML